VIEQLQIPTNFNFSPEQEECASILWDQ